MLTTYENCHKILNDVREALNENSTARLQGTSTSGVYNNDWIVTQINNAQRRIYGKLYSTVPSQFLAYADVSVVNSVVTLPWDFGRIVEFKNAEGLKIFPSTVKVLPLTNGVGSKYIYYRKGMTFVLNRSGINDTYKLWYHSKPRDMTQGLCGTENTLATTSKVIADYYNNMLLESITGDWVDTITDYTAARVVTLASQTLDVSDYYGTVSELPEPFHGLIAPYAAMICRALHPLTQKPVTTDEVEIWRDQFTEALTAFGNEREDESIEEIFTDYDTDNYLGGVLFPGESYLIG